jgi:hypothetical protein
MCTYIAVTAPVDASGKGAGGWFPITQATVGFDHPVSVAHDHALLLDFVNPALGPSARVALEMSLDSGRSLLEQLKSAIAQAEDAGF